ncbi:hypothetical protein JVU11DRAFT_9538 [Chiua virens]|nr:hypothetical protein JVU11DRAFT_9538 [Chiua virens]
MDSSLPIDQGDRVIFPVHLGTASKFNREIFPLYRRRDSLGLGDVYLEATLDEMLKIIKIGNRPQQWQEILDSTKDQYDQLMLWKADLEQRPKSKNPLKAFTNYRAVRMFLAASKSLYSATKSRSEEMIRSNKRSLLSISAEDGQSANDDVSPDDNIDGISVRVKHPLDDSTKQKLLDVVNTIASYSGPFRNGGSTSETSSILTDDYALASESLASLAGDDMEEAPPDATSPEPSSPTIIQNNQFVIYALNSTLNGTTLHFGGNQNSGAVTHVIMRANDT